MRKAGRLTPHGVSGLKFRLLRMQTEKWFRLTPHGVSGLKWKILCDDIVWRISLTPHGVSGLKSCRMYTCRRTTKSHSTRSEWIEIATSVIQSPRIGQSHSTRSEWIEISLLIHFCPTLRSHSTRSEWIEIDALKRNHNAGKSLTPHGVSGLKYGVFDEAKEISESHSTRSEWIEIIIAKESFP